MSKAKIISLYTGAGGLDYGFEAAGFETAVAVEMDHDCCETLRLNRRWAVIERDILDVTTTEIMEAGGLKSGEADLLSAARRANRSRKQATGRGAMLFVSTTRAPAR